MQQYTDATKSFYNNTANSVPKVVDHAFRTCNAFGLMELGVNIYNACVAWACDTCGASVPTFAPESDTPSTQSCAQYRDATHEECLDYYSPNQCEDIYCESFLFYAEPDPDYIAPRGSTTSDGSTYRVGYLQRRWLGRRWLEPRLHHDRLVHVRHHRRVHVVPRRLHRDDLRLGRPALRSPRRVVIPPAGDAAAGADRRRARSPGPCRGPDRS